jgi:hypothetical protein
MLLSQPDKHILKYTASKEPRKQGAKAGNRHPRDTLGRYTLRHSRLAINRKYAINKKYGYVCVNCWTPTVAGVASGQLFENFP